MRARVAAGGPSLTRWETRFVKTYKEDALKYGARVDISIYHSLGYAQAHTVRSHYNNRRGGDPLGSLVGTLLTSFDMCLARAERTDFGQEACGTTGHRRGPWSGFQGDPDAKHE